MLANAGDRIRLPIPFRIQTISWQPRVAVYHNFLSTDECDHIKQVASPFVSLFRSYVEKCDWLVECAIYIKFVVFLEVYPICLLEEIALQLMENLFEELVLSD